MSPPVRKVDSNNPPPLVSLHPSSAPATVTDAPQLVVAGSEASVDRNSAEAMLPPALLKDLQAKGLAAPPPNAAAKPVWLGNAPVSPTMKAAAESALKAMNEGRLKPGQVIVLRPEPQTPAVDLTKPIDPEATRHAMNRSLMQQGLKPLPDPNFKPTDFEKRIEKEKLSFRPVYDPNTGDISAYTRESNGYWEKMDREGKRLASGEKPLETPPIDPIDLIPVPGGPAAKGATVGLRGLLGAAGKVVAKDVAELGGKEALGAAAKKGARAVGAEAIDLAVKESVEVGTRDLAEIGIKEAGEGASHIGANRAGAVGKVPVYNPSGGMENCSACVAGMMKSKLTKSLWDADRIMGKYGFVDRTKNFNIQKTLSYIEVATEKTANPKVADFAAKQATPGHYAIIVGPAKALVKGEGEHVVYGRVLDNGARYIFDPQTQKFTSLDALLRRYGGVRAFHFQ